jgi:hypothetical protein
MLVKVFNNLWRTSTVKVTILSLVFSRRNILDFLSYKSFPDLRVRVHVYITCTHKPEPGYLSLSNVGNHRDFPSISQRHFHILCSHYYP